MGTRKLLSGLVTLIVAVLAMGLAFAQSSNRLIIELDATPPHLDVMSNTTGEVLEPAHHVFETLFSFDAGFRPTPMLVDTWDVNEDGTSWTFTLREGVLFHNGKEMTVDDVEASFERWAQVSRLGKTYGEVIFERLGDYSFRIVSTEVRANMLENLSGSSQAFVIIPAEIVQAAGTNELTDPSQWIGTGPYMFESIVPDQSIVLRAFPDYVGRDEPPSGHGGGKVALIEVLEWRIIKDVPTRTAALRAGEIDIIPDGVSGSDKPTLEDDPDLVVQVIPGFQKWGPMFNGTREFVGQPEFRLAIAYAMDHEELALAMVGDPDVYDVNPGLAFKGSFYYSEAGAEFWNQQDPERVQELLDEVGYAGEEIVIISTKANVFQDRMATVLSAQLADVGINTRIDWYDGATIREVRTQPDQWDIIPGGWGTTFDPAIYAQAFHCDSGAWSGICHPGLDEIFDRAAATIDLDERREVYEELQVAMLGTYMPMVYIGDFHALRAYRSNLDGVRDYKDFRAWGVSKN